MKNKFLLLLLFLAAFALEVSALKPKKDYINTPKDFGIPYTEQKVKSGNATIVTWNMLKVKALSAPTIIMCNSDYGNMSYLLKTAAGLYKEGYNIVLFDYRGFGQSSAFQVDSNQLYYDEYCDDLIAVYKYCTAKTKAPVYLYGQSMGTIVSTICMARNKELSGAKFIFEAFIEDLDNAVGLLKNLKNRTFKLPASHSNYNNYVRQLYGRQGLVFVGSDDAISSNGKINYRQTKWTIVPFTGGHLAATYVLEADFYKRIKQFAY